MKVKDLSLGDYFIFRSCIEIEEGAEVYVVGPKFIHKISGVIRWTKSMVADSEVIKVKLY